MIKPILLSLTGLLVSLSAFGNQISEDQQHFVKRYEKHKKLVPPGEALINKDPEPKLCCGFTELYNGKDLSGWTARGGECTFEARGDVIVGTTVKGSPSTYLSTDKEDYEDFIFTAELKWEVAGNSGIMFRAQRKAGKKHETVYGPQCEMEGDFADDRRGWSGGIYGQSDGGWIYPLWLEAHAEARQALKKGEWNRVTIQAVGNEFKTWINGVPAARWIDANGEYPKGFFSLQVHSGKQGEIHFRNVKVKELEPGWKDLFASGDFSQWTKVNGDPVPHQWTINDGIVHREKNGGGGIITKTQYKDFELRFDWKISEAGNSGIKYRTRGRLGLEYQVLDDDKHKDAKDPTHRAGSLYDILAAPDDKPLNAPGEWNSGRIVAHGNHIEHWLNGSLVATIELGSDDWKQRFEKSKYRKHEGFGTWTGPILLQDHYDKVWYRNIRIREL
ncbi:DUF1080 domain-containing protein [Coraliomargarita sinensis]|uniref:DUF1080 domain-containing protein n=1 Tax=Coraliomargarita sinensis TaxID=2174842 RepID=A0A317ZKG1_9BACT|nr:DUF1080 domain-containing protein [Coraliomargarita sinensis]PXA04299.1 DUF1080 domain-containing protein [Coraliomargarita sinensis]